MNQAIRLLLIDDHSLFRESLSRLLQAETDFRIVATCASVAEGLRVIEREAVDVVLLDHDLGEEQGYQFLDGARECSFGGRILLVTAGMPGGAALRALEAGSSGIFLKHSPPTRLVEAIHKVAGGELWLDSSGIRSLVSFASGRSDERRGSQELDGRERSVLKGVFEGLANKEIAARLNLSESSVKSVLQQLFQKTGVRTRSQLVRIALERHAEDWLNGIL